MSSFTPQTNPLACLQTVKGAMERKDEIDQNKVLVMALIYIRLIGKLGT